MSEVSCTESAAAERQAIRGSRRRRLWELPASAHDLLLATSFDPEALRRELGRTMARLHKARCELAGSDADVLYGAVHDLGRRNAVSEAMQRKLEQMHVAAVHRWASLRGPERLKQAWCAALQADAVAPALWALLTHPGALALEQAVLYDARAWVFRHARRSLAGQTLALAQGARTAALEGELAQLRGRLEAQQRTHQAQLDAARHDAARIMGHMQHWRGACERLQAAAATPSSAPDDAASAPPETIRSVRPDLAMPAAAAPPATAIAAAPGARTAAAPAAAVAGKQVLCVGGMQHAVARYRSHVERLGGRFEHHDGGLEEGVRRLDGRLARADLVICQAGCVNHEAYRRIKQHCTRAGKPCLYLDRPSLARFERALGPGQNEEIRHA